MRMALLAVCLCPAMLWGQSGSGQEKPRWYIGLMGGYRFGSASISELDSDFFPGSEREEQRPVLRVRPV